MKEAVAAAYPQTELQRCIVHQVRNTLKYVGEKNKKEFADAPQNILISLRCAPLHQDILHRGLDKRQYSIYTEKGKRVTDQPLLPQSHFSAVDCFYRVFFAEPNFFSSVEHFILELTDYIDWYNNKRIMLKLDGLLLSNTDTEQHSKSDQNRFWSLCIIFT